ncbi:DUF4214 domain-containing protein [Pseudomonas syringae]|uniref:DUF4214 domain-containing protein n=1 Tax=Pseudomonas syringae TaxID=317 RepID=A0A085VNY2_PSESX|nr:DUF4214 domain-containing protein [Pseudomonas syringae]KFE57145.1 hypothetical protein IV01_05560 [Pseudomonas syringae]
MATSDYLNQVQKLYIAYFGRPADPTGLNYWANQVNAAGGNIAVAIAGFAASTESSNLFGSFPSAQKISAIYLNLFNRLPESAGLSYWMNQLDSGAITQAQAAWEIMNQAGAGDATSVANKLTMANVFTAQVDTTAEIAGYSGAQPAAYGRAYLAGVDATPGSVSVATTALNNSVADATGVRPTAPTAPSTPSIPTGDTVFTFTTATDNFTGGAGNDTFVGLINTTTPANSTLVATDRIDGGAGTDTLSITVTGTGNTALPGLTIGNVEKLSIRDQSSSGKLSTYDVSGTGMTDVTSSVSTASGGLQFVNLTTGATVSLLGDKSTQVANVQFVMANSTDTVNLVLDGGLQDTVAVTGQTTVTNFGGAASTATITSSGAANTLGAIRLAGSGTDSITTAAIKANVNLAASLVNTDYAANATLTVTGAGKVDLGRTVGFDGRTVDASANSGGLSIAVDGNTQTFTGGKGNDTVIGTAPVADTAVIDGGAGTDTFSATLLSGTNGAAFKSFEVLDLSGAGAVNGGVVDALTLTRSTLTGVVLNGTTSGTLTVNHLTNTPDGFNVTLKSGSSGANTVLQFDNVSGTSDALNLTHDSTNTAAALGRLNIEGIETIKIASGGSLVGTVNSVNIIDNAAQLIEITGNREYSLNVTAQSGTVASQLTKVDGSQATGPLSIKVEAATTTGGQSKLDLLGGSGADTFIVETSSVANSTGVTVTTNAGNDTVNVSNASLRDVSALAKLQFTTITDFQAGDSVQLPTSVNFQSAAVDVSGAGGDLLAALQLAAAGSVNNRATWFQFDNGTGIDSYLVVNRVANSNLTADDVVIKLAGVTDLSGLQGSGGSTLML